MAETNNKVTIDIVADAEGFRKQLKEAAKDLQDFNKTGLSMKKAGVKGSKEIAAMDKSIRKMQAQDAADLYKHEKKLIDLYNMKLKKQKELHKQGQQDTQQAKDLRRELQQVAKETQNVVRQRVAYTKASRGPGGGWRGSAGRIGGGVRNGLLVGGGLAVGAVAQRLGSGINAFEELQMAQQAMTGSRMTQDQINKLTATGTKYGYKATETAQQAGALMRMTGGAGGIGAAQAFSRTGMVAFGQTAELMGLQARGGLDSAQSKKQLEQLLAVGVRTGVEKARTGELVSGITTLANLSQSRTAGNAGLENAMSAMSLLGRNQDAGLTGARGAGVAAQLDKAIRQPGGGEAGKSLLMRAFGFGGAGNTSFVDATRRMEQGFLGEGGAANLQDLIKQVGKEYGNGDASSKDAIYALSKVTGIDQAVLDKVVAAAQGGASTGQIAALTEGQKPIEEQALEVMKTDLGGKLGVLVQKNDNLIKEGERIAASTQQLSKDIDNIMHDVMMALLGPLRELVDLVRNVYNLVVDLPGMGGNKLKAPTVDFTAEQGLLSSAAESYKAGKLTGGEYKSQLLKTRQGLLARKNQMGSSSTNSQYDREISKIDAELSNNKAAKYADLTQDEANTILSNLAERGRAENVYNSSTQKLFGLQMKEQTGGLSRSEQADKASLEKRIALAENILATITEQGIRISNPAELAEENANAAKKNMPENQGLQGGNAAAPGRGR